MLIEIDGGKVELIFIIFILFMALFTFILQQFSDSNMEMDGNKTEATSERNEKYINDLKNELYSYKALFMESFVQVQEGNNAKLVQTLQKEVESLKKKLETVEQKEITLRKEHECLKQQLNSTGQGVMQQQKQQLQQNGNKLAMQTQSHQSSKVQQIVLVNQQPIRPRIINTNQAKKMRLQNPLIRPTMTPRQVMKVASPATQTLPVHAAQNPGQRIYILQTPKGQFVNPQSRIQLVPQRQLQQNPKDVRPMNQLASQIVTNSPLQIGLRNAEAENVNLQAPDSKTENVGDIW